MTGTVLVTGASGFIGRQCLPILGARGYRVHAVSKRGEGPCAPGVRWHAADLLSEGAADALLAKLLPEQVLHLAWIATPGEFWTSPLNATWERATVSLAEACARNGVRRIVAAGTCAEYDRDAGVCREGVSAIVPYTPYGRCKDGAHRALESLAARHGFEAAWARIFTPYGPGEDPRRLVASVVRLLLRGEPALCTAGTQLRDFLHVADVAEALVSLLDSRVQGAINIGSGEAVTVASVVRAIGERLNAQHLVRLGARPMPPGEPGVVVADVTRLREEVGFAAGRTLADGLDDTIEYWRHVA